MTELLRAKPSMQAAKLPQTQQDAFARFYRSARETGFRAALRTNCSTVPSHRTC